ncbi:MAG TPA: MFS transporter [Acetobacteraceae bacterium]|nr:MFS transporter [Acetobacteraceae bacterium]
MSAPPAPRRLAAVLGIVQVLAWATTYYLPAIIAGPVAHSFGQSRTVVLGAFSWALVVSGLISPLVGRWIDRSGGRVVLATGALLQAAGLVALAASPSLAAWYAAWTVLGVGMALGLYDAAFATAGRQLGEAARPAIIGITLLGGFASTVGWPIGTMLFAQLGWRRTALIYAAIHLLVNLPLILASVPRRAPMHPVPVAAPLPGVAVPPDARRWNFRLLAGFFTIRGFLAGMVTVQALVLLQALGLSRGEAVFAAALIGPAQVGARLLEWAFGRFLNPLLTSRLGAALMPLGILAPLAGAPGLVLTLAYGASNGVLTISRGTLPLYLLGPRGYAVVIGRLAMPVMLATALAPTLTAPLFVHLPVGWILAGTAAVSAAAALCLWPLRAQPTAA